MNSEKTVIREITDGVVRYRYKGEIVTDPKIIKILTDYIEKIEADEKAGIKAS